ncbi:MAG: ATP-dependent helicase UvrD/PcrA [Patescibacteria group bacterium]|nr:ATP-dependent helicase UvrD/PcrA [Patescibacteria group bacterium]
MAVEYLNDLNDKQKEAATAINGPVLIVAGAGAGKTKTIISRIAHLIKNGVAPENILAVTFTNKAAKEMTTRLESALDKDRGLRGDKLPFASTFHSLGVYILRQHAQMVGLNRFFTILDRDESLALIKTAMDQAGVDRKQYEPRKILGSISREKGKGVRVAEYRLKVDGYWQEIVASVWEKYDKLVREANALDFDDLLLSTVLLLASHEDIRAFYQDRFRYIHIDEYQDTNHVQYSLARLLVGADKNICVVGDVDQSIYSWRGADFGNMLRFEEDYPEAKVILLEQNYRSTKTILEAANEVIKKNRERVEKNLFTENGDGEKINLTANLSEGEEARSIAQTAKDLIASHTPAEEIAILYRANFQSRILEEAFLKANVPYQVLGVRFFERKEVKDILTYFRAALNPNDFEAMNRIINVPKRGIGKATLAKVSAGQEENLPQKMIEKLSSFRALLATLRHKIERETVSENIKYILSASGLEKELISEREEGLERLENVRELVTLAKKYDHLPGEEAILALLTEAALVSDQDTLREEKNGVRLMTVHASKGLEFDVVFIAGLEQGLFPHKGFGESDRDEEEERRLFYVAITRARKKVWLSYAQLRTIFGSQQVNTPSEFILDIPDQLIEGADPAAPQYEFLLDF